MTNDETVAEARKVLDWLYDVSPVWPDQVPRAKLLALYREYLETEKEP